MMSHVAESRGLFCHRYPKEIPSYIHAEENDLRRKTVANHDPHKSNYAEERLHSEQPVFALAREWCDEEEVSRFDEVQHLRDEVYRLRNLITSVARWLRDHGHPLSMAT